MERRQSLPRGLRLGAPLVVTLSLPLGATGFSVGFQLRHKV